MNHWIAASLELEYSRRLKKVKVKASHTRHRALDPELIPVYRQSACMSPLSHPPGGRLPLLSARPAVTSPAAEHHRPLAGTKLYCLVTEALGVNNLPKVVIRSVASAGFEPATYWSQAQMPYRCTTAPPRSLQLINSIMERYQSQD